MVKKYSYPSRIPFWEWEPIVTQRIPPAYELCSVYIYKTVKKSDAGENSGGSGFIVRFPFQHNIEEYQLYVITNRHVIEKMAEPVLRLNDISGKSQSQKTNKDRWAISKTDDLAAYPLIILEEEFQISAVPVGRFATPHLMKSLKIGPGDDVFMVGRFISHEGKQRNTPSIRFGNISMLNKETMQNGFEQDQETFLTEMRSIPGYSGSPVFVTLDPKLPRPWDSDIPEEVGRATYVSPSPSLISSSTELGIYAEGIHGPWLLGIDWTHINNYSPVLRRKGSSRDPKDCVKGRWIESHTGMAGVIPAWKIRELLDTEKLAAQREKEDAKISKKKAEEIG